MSSPNTRLQCNSVPGRPLAENSGVDTGLLDSHALLIAAAAVAFAAASLAAFGLRQRRYRGWRAWVAAPWLTAGGVALAALAVEDPQGPAGALAGVLLLQAPIWTLIGLRRFQARQPLPGHEAVDLAMLGIAMVLTLSAPLARADGPIGALLPGAAAAALHLYAACLVFGAPGGREGLPLQTLGLVTALAGLAPLPAGWGGESPAVPLEWRALASALAAIVGAFIVMTLVCERTERQLRDSHRRLRALANLDALTHLPNRRRFHELTDPALRHDPPGSATLLLFDIDHFKLINDHFGHATGDRALKLVSQAMLEVLRACDIAGRHGGDEFVLLLRGADVGHGQRVAARIVERLQLQAEPAALPPLTLSFGIVQVNPGETLDDALRRADRGLYEAKRQGRSRAVTTEGDEAQPVFTESQRLGLTAL